jgi:hypothetical protein
MPVGDSVDVEHALTLYEAAIERDPLDHETLYQYSRFWRHFQRWEEVRAALDSVLSFSAFAPPCSARFSPPPLSSLPFWSGFGVLWLFTVLWLYPVGGEMAPALPTAASEPHRSAKRSLRSDAKAQTPQLGRTADPASLPQHQCTRRGDLPA